MGRMDREAGPARWHRTASEYAFEVIKHWILSGKLMPEERIDQDKLAADLGISKMPVRSALARLAAEGLVNIYPHRGAAVTALSEENLNEVYLLRCQIESLVLKIAVPLATQEDIRDLHAMVDEQEELTRRPDVDAVLDSNRHFHMYTYRMSRLDLSLRIIEGLWDQSERYRRIFLNEPGMLEGSTNDHRRLVELIAADRADEAADFLVEHNLKTKKVILEHIHRHKGAG